MHYDGFRRFVSVWPWFHSETNCCLSSKGGPNRHDCSPDHTERVSWSKPSCVCVCVCRSGQSAWSTILPYYRPVAGCLYLLPCTELFTLADWATQLLWHRITAWVLERASPPNTHGWCWTSDPFCLGDTTPWSVNPSFSPRFECNKENVLENRYSLIPALAAERAKLVSIFWKT